MDDLLTAVALAIALEGAAYALFPQQMKRMMLTVLGLPAETIRTAGLVAVVLGAGAVWLIRR